MKKIYIVGSNIFNIWHENMFFCWRPNTDFFWTRREVVIDILKNNPEYNKWPHKFAFKSKRKAFKFAKKQKLQGEYTIEEFFI